MKMVNNVYISAVTPDNISRHELLAWVNDSLQSSLSKIEEMSSGAAYCQMTHILFPDAIVLKKVKWNSRNDIDWINNWKILQTSWKTIGIDKPVPVERLLRAKFQENFEFLQWFKKFFDANYDGHEYDALAERAGEAFPMGAKVGAGGRAAPARAAPAPRAAPAAAPTRRAPAAVTTSRPSPAAAPPARAQARTSVAAAASRAAPAAPAAPAIDPSLIKELEDKVEAYAEQAAVMEGERDFYYEKLIALENMCKSLPEGTTDVSAEAVLAVIYAESAAAMESAMTAVEAEHAENGVPEDGGHDENVPAAAEPAAVAVEEKTPAPVAAAAAAPAAAPAFLEDDDDETF